MSNPFPFPQPVQHNTAPVQHPNADPAYAAFLASMQAQQAPVQQFAPHAPAFPVQQFAPPAPAPVPLAQGSLDDFYGQPTVGGGAAWKFPNGSIGTPAAVNVGIVSRAIVQGDVEQATDIHNNPQTFKDGRPKFQLKVPVTNADGTEGTWYVKGNDRDELTRAMTEAGAPAGPPEKGAAIRVTYVRDKANGPGMSPTKVKTVEYMRPAGATETPAPAVAQTTTPAPVQYAGGAPADVAALNNVPVPAPAAPVQQAAPAPAAVTLDADQAALLAQLTGG